MSKTHYQNFDVEFYASVGVYHVKARSFNGEAKHQFSLPFSIAQAQESILTIEKSINSDKFDISFVKEFGGRLFEVVFDKEVRAIYKSALDLARAHHKDGLRLRFHLQDVPELSHLPWEYLYESSTNQFLCLDRQTPLVRYLDIPKIIAPLKVETPLHILVMISSPTTLPQLDINAEKTKLQNALADLQRRGLVQMTWLENATVAELQKTLRNSIFHVFHFIGHGGFDDATKQGLLVLETVNELEDPVSAEQLSAILNNHQSLRLVILNSCKGARTSIVNSYAGTAITLVQKGIAAVAAMQFTISDAAAIRFTDEFYGAIADGLPVDMAMTEARVALFSGDHHPEWGTPVLFMRSSDGSLFDWARVKTKNRRNTTQPQQEKYKARAEAKNHSSGDRLFKQRKTGITAFFYILITLLFVTIFLLSVIPKSTDVEVEIYTKQLSFVLSKETNEEEKVSLLHSGLWTNSVSIEQFQPIQLTISSLRALGQVQKLVNPLFITPDPRHGKMTFISPSGFSLQKILCTAGSKITLKRQDENLVIEIEQNAENSSLTLGLAEDLTVSMQECQVVDDDGQNFTELFKNQVDLQLHDLSRSLTIIGAEGALTASIKRDRNADQEKVKYIMQQAITELNFSKNVVGEAKNIEQSTIDSLRVAINSPSKSVSFKSRNTGDVAIMSNPNKFLLKDLSEIADGFKVWAQGRFKKFTTIQGARQIELVPKYLEVITQYPTVSLLASCLGWIAAVLIPLILKLRLSYRKRG